MTSHWFFFIARPNLRGGARPVVAASRSSSSRKSLEFWIFQEVRFLTSLQKYLELFLEFWTCCRSRSRTTRPAVPFRLPWLFHNLECHHWQLTPLYQTINTIAIVSSWQQRYQYHCIIWHQQRQLTSSNHGSSPLAFSPEAAEACSISLS